MKTVVAALVGTAIVVHGSARAQTPVYVAAVQPVVQGAKPPVTSERQRELQEERRRAQEILRERQRDQHNRPYAHKETETVSRSVKIGGRGEIVLSNLAGDIVITRGGGNEVHIEAVKTAHGRNAEDAREMLQLVQVNIAERETRAEARVHYPRGDRRTSQGATAHRNLNVSVAYNVTAPEHAAVTVRTLSGSIKVSDIKGELSLASTSGNVSIYNAANVSDAKSTSGQVEIANTRSETDIEASSISGNVIVRQVRAPRMELGSVSGRVFIQQVECPRIDAQSMSGDVELATELAKNGRYDLNSHSGTIRIIVTGNRGFELDANSFSGTVRADVQLSGEVVAAGARGGGNAAGRGIRSLRGSYGDGSAAIDVTTFSGNVIVTKK